MTGLPDGRRRTAAAVAACLVLAGVLGGGVALLAAAAFLAGARLAPQVPARAWGAAGSVLVALAAPAYLLTRAPGPGGISLDFTSRDRVASGLAVAGLTLVACSVLGPRPQVARRQVPSGTQQAQEGDEQ